MANKNITIIALFALFLLASCSSEDKVPHLTSDPATSLLNSGMFDGERKWRTFGKVPSFPTEDERRHSGQTFFSDREGMPYTQMMAEFKESVEERLAESPLYAIPVQSNIYRLIDRYAHYLEEASDEDMAWLLETLLNTQAVEWETLADLHLSTRHLRDDSRNMEIGHYIQEGADKSIVTFQGLLEERQGELSKGGDSPFHDTHQFAIKNLEGDIAMTRRALAMLEGGR